MKFSILVPVYNVQNYLEDCILSLLNQEFTEYEVILYNDASTDSSGLICDRYASNNPNIKVIHGKTNIGLLRGREQLVKAACGEYVVFVDGDDYVDQRLLSKVYDAFQETECDVVMYDFYGHYELKIGVKYDKKFEFFNTKIIYREKALEKLYSCVADFNINTIWRKAFRREIWPQEEIAEKYRQVTVMEDLYLTLRLFEKANSVTYIPERLYYYRCNFSSISHVFRENRIFDKLKVLEYMKDFLCTRGLYEENKSKIFEQIIYATEVYIKSMAASNCKLNQKQRYDYFARIRKNKQFCVAVENVRECPRVVSALYHGNNSIVDEYIRSHRFCQNVRFIVGNIVLK